LSPDAGPGGGGPGDGTPGGGRNGQDTGQRPRSDAPAAPGDADLEPGKLIWEGAPTWRSRLSATLLALFCVLLGLGAFAWAAARWGMRLEVTAALAPAAIGLVLLLVQWIRLSSIRYRLTTKRIEWEQGLLSRRIDGIDVWRIRHVEYYQSLADRIARVSRIHIYVQDREDPQVTVIGLPATREVYDRVAAAAQVGRRGTLGIVQ
jgi:membrane protein YdbS with pleckstrin-like domain